MIICVEFFGDLFFEINLFYYEKIPYKQRVKKEELAIEKTELQNMEKQK